MWKGFYSGYQPGFNLFTGHILSLLSDRLSYYDFILGHVSQPLILS